MGEKSVKFYKTIANELSSPMIEKDYGPEGLDRLVLLTNSISEIYNYLRFESFSQIVIYSTFDSALTLERLPDSRTVKYNSTENICTVSGRTLTIEIKDSSEIFVSADFLPDINDLRQNGVVYKRDNSEEFLFGKTEQKLLPKTPNNESWFAIPTFKRLDEALEDYKVRFARNSNCPLLGGVWFSENKIYFVPKPETHLRNSLHFHLYSQLRSAEVRPEQNMDKSHPVDIKITWSLTNRLAIIEIKWLGMSYNDNTKRITQTFNSERAQAGAEQLKNYLDQNKEFAPDKITIGYLVVFDGRRNVTGSIVDSLTREQAESFQNDELIYDPDYSAIRNDFAKPIRFFMEAKFT